MGGPVLVVLAGLTLATFGRGLYLEPPRLALAAAALALLAAAVTIGAARWGSPDLDHIRGAQSVLGPTLLVGSMQVGIGVAAAALGALLAGSVWLGSLPGFRRFGWVAFALESMLVALLLLTVFWWPAAHGGGWATGSTASLLIGAAVGGVLAALAAFSHRASAKFALGLLGVAVAGVASGIWFLGGSV
ncbi:MAG: hypothetical protein ABR505_08690 [Actinomycetota bacterium]